MSHQKLRWVFYQLRMLSKSTNHQESMPPPVPPIHCRLLTKTKSQLLFLLLLLMPIGHYLKTPSVWTQNGTTKSYSTRPWLVESTPVISVSTAKRPPWKNVWTIAVRRKTVISVSWSTVIVTRWGVTRPIFARLDQPRQHPLFPESPLKRKAMSKKVNLEIVSL